MSDNEDAKISYIGRRVQVIDGIILGAITGVFAFVFNTDRNVSTLVAEKQADEKQEARDPVIRTSAYRADMGVMRERLGDIDGRVEKLERSREQSSSE